MRWEYLRGQGPSDSARRLHKIYRATESAGSGREEVKTEGRKTRCARECATTLLFDLSNPNAFSQAEIRLALEILDGLPVPELGLRQGRHSHGVDLAGSGRPERIDKR